jgi:hypothetical protein
MLYNRMARRKQKKKFHQEKILWMKLLILKKVFRMRLKIKTLINKSKSRGLSKVVYGCVRPRSNVAIEKFKSVCNKNNI